jgi:hypothetical protein
VELARLSVGGEAERVDELAVAMTASLRLPGYAVDIQVGCDFRRPMAALSSIHLEPGAQQQSEEFPLRAIIDDQFARLNTLVEIDGRWVGPAEWPALSLAGSGMIEGAAQIEIINICKARLFRRTATLDQRGFVWSSGDAGYPTERKGTLGSTAIDAQCPGPDGHIRFQAGPFYPGGGASDRSRLADWGGSYVRLRPPEKYPQEWALAQDRPTDAQ